MLNKDYRLYGTKILNQNTKEVGLLICIWKNKFADAKIDCLGFAPRARTRHRRGGSFAFEPAVLVSSIPSLSGRCRTEIR